MLTRGNLKLNKRVYSFSIPAGSKGSCGRDCKGCYALKIERLRPSVKLKRMEDFVIAQSSWFYRFMEAEIKHAIKHGCKYLRIHEGGDFFHQHYVDQWVKLVKRFPKLTFYGYTKRFGNFDLTKLEKLPNCVLLDSLQARQGKPNFDTERNLLKEKVFICRVGKGGKCGSSCTYCMSKNATKKPPCFILHESGHCTYK